MNGSGCAAIHLIHVATENIQFNTRETRKIMNNLNMECYPEEEEDVPLEEEDSSDDDEEEDNEEYNEYEDRIDREIIVRGNRPHQFEPLARNGERRLEPGGEPYRMQWINEDADRLINTEWLVEFSLHLLYSVLKIPR